MPRDRKIDELRQKLLVTNPRRFPQFRIHANRSETGDRIQFVEEKFSAYPIKEQVDSSHPFALQHSESFSPELLRALCLVWVKLRRDNQCGAVLIQILRLVRIEFMRRVDLTRDANQRIDS